MIKVNKIVPFTCEAFTSDNVSLGFINEYEFNDLRIQIKEAKVEGYYMLFNGEKLYIDTNGRVTGWPVGFYDVIENQLMNIL